MSKKVVILGGAGAMGQIIVRDLMETSSFDEIVIADFDEAKAEQLKDSLKNKKLSTAKADIRDRKKMVPVLKDAFAVINSTPYYYNVEVMEAALEAGCHYLDLGGLFHVSKKQLELNERFKQKNLLAILGMGAAPGTTNIMAAVGAKELDVVDSIDVIVGCTDLAPSTHPLTPPYALDTILDEYTKEPMVFEDGEYRAKPPMSGGVVVEFPQPVGRCEAIYTLHSEVLTLATSFKDKGVKRVTFRLGLPSDFHEKLSFLAQLGLCSAEPLETEVGSIAPRSILAKLIAKFPQPQGQDPDDAEVIRVDVAGSKKGKRVLCRMETTVLADLRWKVSCGALDTGVPPSIVAQMLLAGDIKSSGVQPPELCVEPTKFFDELAKRSMIMRRIVEEELTEVTKKNLQTASK